MRRNKEILASRETQYLNSWLRRFGKKDVYKYRNVPGVILSEYEKDIEENSIFFADGTRDHRLKFISNYIDFVVNIEPKYKKLIKLYNLKGWQIGAMLGYKNQFCWHRSYKRYTYIRFLVTMINKHEEVLNSFKQL